MVAARELEVVIDLREAHVRTGGQERCPQAISA